MLRRLFFISCLLLISGCGAIYISPKVQSSEDTNVAVIPVTPASVSTANASPYTPRRLPSEFSRTAQGQGMRGIGLVPDPIFEPEVRPTTLSARLPPIALQPGPYRIGVGDVILLATKGNNTSIEQLSGLLAAQNSRQGYTVQDDGAIAIPDVGRIEILDMTLEEVEAVVFQALVAKQVDPSFSVEIAEFNSQKVSVGGAVRNPTVTPITLTPLYLDEALTRAGGVSSRDAEFAAIRLYRDGTLYQIPLNMYLEQPELQKTLLLAGDSIFVDTKYELDKAQAYFTEQVTIAQIKAQRRATAINELNTEISLQRAMLTERRNNFQSRLGFDAVKRDYVYLTGEVNNSGRFALPFEQKASLADALFGEGGFRTRTGNPGEIYVIRDGSARRDLSQINAWHLDGKNAVNFLLSTKLELRPDDIIFVAEQPVTKWDRVISQLTPSLFTSTASQLTGN